MAENSTLKREELAKLLQTPLDPKLDYFDATESIKALAEHVRGLHKLVQFLASSLTQQGTSILDIREKMIEHKNAIEMIADMISGEEQDPQLVGFEEPKIIMPRNN